MILPSKLQIPLPPTKTLDRPRLTARLREAFRLPVTVMAADAGFGKTTLVSSVLANDNRPSVWYRLDASDSDPSNFSAHLLYGLRRHMPRRAYTAAVRGLTQITDWNAAAQLLSLAMPRLRHEVLIVLDDFHLLTAPTLNEGMTRLIDRLPPRTRLAILTRVVPGLTLPRWRVQGRIAEIGSDDLRFTVPELRALLVELHGVPLSDPSLHLFAARTEGWPAGVVLALHAALAQGPAGAVQSLNTLSGSTRDIYDYMAQEAFERQTPEVQRFMLATAAVSRFSVALASSLLGTSARENRETLDHLEHSHLFIVPLDRERHWYRYHHLFEEFLKRTGIDRDFAWLQDVHRHAAAWWEQHGEMSEVLKHLVACGDFARATFLIGSHGLDMVARGHFETIRRWLSAIPKDRWAAGPRLYLIRGLTEVVSGKTKEGIRSLHEATHRLRAVGDMEGEITALRWLANAVTWDGGLLSTAVLSEFAEVGTRLASFPLPARAHLLAATARIAHWQGDIPLAEQRFQEALTTARSSGDDYTYLWCARHQAELFSSTARFSEAIALFEEVLALTRRRDWFHEAAHFHIELADVLLLIGQHDNAERHLSEARLLQATIPCRVLQAELALVSARSAARWGSRERAEIHLRELLGSSENMTSYGQWRFDATVELSLLLVNTNRHDAHRLATGATDAKEKFGMFRSARGLLAFGIVSRSAEYCQQAAKVFATIRAPQWQALALLNATALAPTDENSTVADGALQSLRSLNAEAWEFLLAQAVPDLFTPFEADPLVGPKIRQASVPSQELRIAIRCLGSFEVIRSGQLLGQNAWQRAAPRRLLQYLLLQDRPVHREEAIEVLWPSLQPHHGANQLRVALTYLRQMLEPARRARELSSLLITSGSTIAIARDRLDLDLDRFNRGLAQASASDSMTRRDALVEALGLYRGPLFADDPFEEWVQVHRDRLSRQYVEALCLLAEIEENEGHYQAAVLHWLTAIKVDPVAEQAYRGLIRSYLALGRVPDALRAFESCRQALAGLDTVPSPETLALRRSIPSPN